MRDRFPVNEGYVGVVADAYDTWLPVDELWPDEIVCRGAFGDVEGPILELGCGTGRPLLRWLAEGVDVQGLDASADMLRILRRHADERGLEPVLHHGDFAPLTIEQCFGGIVCLAGSFMLIDDDARARDALISYREHLSRAVCWARRSAKHRRRTPSRPSFGGCDGRALMRPEAVHRPRGNPHGSR
jgi:SAM-dependent methyltransferase